MSIDAFPQPNPQESFEAKMQRLYIGPIHGIVLEMQESLEKIGQYPELKDTLIEMGHWMDELPEHAMHESELQETLELYKAALATLRDENTGANQRVASVQELISRSKY